LKKYASVHVIDNPLAQEILTTLRDKNTNRVEFRRGLVTLGQLTGIEVARSMAYTEVEVETPMGVGVKGISFTDAHNLVIINVLRAAMPFVEGLMDVFPAARQGVVSARRIEDGTAAPNYNFIIEMPYCRIPSITPQDTIIIADPMLASGCTLLAVLSEVSKIGAPKRVVITSVVSSPLGIERILARYPKIEIYTSAVDDGLNEHGYIIPGLGDAGDRTCG
jgi:uracil phosphoribosyltransferase